MAGLNARDGVRSSALSMDHAVRQEWNPLCPYGGERRENQDQRKQVANHRITTQLTVMEPGSTVPPVQLQASKLTVFAVG